MPFGIIMSLIVCTVLYIVLAAVMTGMAPWNKLGTAEPMITALSLADGSPRLLTLSRLIVSLGAVIAMSSVLLVFQLGQPRIFMSMARDGLLPPFFARVHPRFKTPYIGTIITGTFVASFAAFANIAEVVDLTNIGTLFAFVLVSAGVIVLRRVEPDRVRPFRAPWVPMTPMLSIVSCLYLMMQLPTITWIRFGIWLALGLDHLLQLRDPEQPAGAAGQGPGAAGGVGHRATRGPGEWPLNRPMCSAPSSSASAPPSPSTSGAWP